MVALRKESVDRNIATTYITEKSNLSLSARRAWIEMPATCCKRQCLLSLSARRAWIEIHNILDLFLLRRSLSARRAWIEITSDADWVRVYVSSLSARRAWIEIGINPDQSGKTDGRSPQGERG